jgi:DNA-binding transcriptional MerR regulator
VAGASAARQPEWTGGGARGETLMSIGEVLAHLRADFPDTTISKLRFLEAEGLVEPSRTPSGYRKYSWEDVARLRYVLTAQRDHYLPLRVIREHLAAQGRPRPTLSTVPAEADTADHAAGPVEDADLRLTRAELLERAGLTEAVLGELEKAGLVASQPGNRYDADALEVATAAAQLAEFGVEPRHLRAYRAAADREVGLFSQLVAPMARQSGPAARARAAETVRELAALTQRVQAALVRAGLRQTLGR